MMTRKEAYPVFIELVGKSSKSNMVKALLIGWIKDLGNIAIKLAKKIPSFAKLL